MKIGFFLCALVMILSSCQGEKEDQSLVAEYKEQRATIEALETEMREVRLAIEDVRVPDEFPNIKKLKTEVKEVVKKREALEKEIRDLGAKKEKAEEDFESYKKNYPIR